MDPNQVAGGLESMLPMLMLSRGTGHSTVDMLLVMLVPLIIRQLLPLIQAAWEKWVKMMDRKANVHERIVAYTQKNTQYSYTGDIDKEPPNHLLQGAILLYLNHTADLASKITAADVQLRRVKKDAALGLGGKGAGADGADDGEDDPLVKRGAGDDDAASSADSWSSWCRPSGDELLDHLGVALVPPENTWVELGDGLKLQRTENTTTAGGDGNSGGNGEGQRATSASSTTTIVLHGATAAQVDGFIQRAWAHFREERRKKKKDESRYLYMPVIGHGGGGGGGEESGGDRWTYKRYKLSDDKTFSSLFHPDKASLLELLDAFSNGRGKFAIPGYPQKLGFLLHGPPGTGKTSFIKALAGHTGRSIVSIPLSRVRTNQELMDMMFDQVVNIEGQDMPVSLPFSKVIFIFEDVDACGDVVEKRAPKAGARGASPAALAAATATTTELTLTHRERRGGHHRKAAAAAAGGEDGGRGGDDQGGCEIVPAAGAEDGGSSSGGSPRVEDSIHFVQRQASLQLPSSSAAAAEAEADIAAFEAAAAAAAIEVAETESPRAARPSGRAIGPLGPGAGWLKKAGGDDALNLAGLLNVLDGVVDTPGRIVVMTTNHPAKLDPALIRPGRINKRIYMGLIAAAQARQMLAHWFGAGALDGAAGARFEAAWADSALSPAALESMCAEHDDVTGLLAALEADPALAAARAGRKVP